MTRMISMKDAATDKPVRLALPGWKKGLLIGSVAMMVVGGAATLAGTLLSDGGAAPASNRNPALPMPHGFAAEVTTDESADDGEPEEGSIWSPFIFRMGFSFFVGFCIAYAVRTFFKITMLVAGVVLLAIFGLQYAGVVDVDWQAMKGHFDNISGWLLDQVSSFRGFISGMLPSSAAGAAGMVIGLKR